MTRADLDESYSTAKFLMNCGEYDNAVNIITFYLYGGFPSYSSSTRTQIHKSQTSDLFKDRYLNLLWGRLACELLLGDWEGVQGDMRQIEGYLKSNEVGFGKEEVVMCRIMFLLLKCCKSVLGWSTMVCSSSLNVPKEMIFSTACLVTRSR